jgi:hypothetical protein
MESLDKSVPVIARHVRRSKDSNNLSLQSHYRVAAAEESDDLRFYIENDVTHVHSAMVTAHQTPIEFYKGYDIGFGSIAQNLDTPRTHQ